MKHLLLLLPFALFALETFAQWEFTGGPYGGRINGLAQDSAGNLYAFKDALGTWAFYKSTDNGQTWFDNGTELNLGGHELLIHPDGFFFLKSKLKIFRSADAGETWQEISTGFSGNLWDMVIHPDGSIFVLTGGNQLLVSSDLGESWSAIEFNTYQMIFMTSDSEGNLFCTGYQLDYLLTSQDNGLSWDSIPKNPSNIMDFNSDLYGRLIMIEDQQVLRSADGGNSWEQIFNAPAHDVIFLTNGEMLLTAHNGVVYKSYDDGNSWQEIKTNAYYTGFYQLHDLKIFAISDDGLYISHDQGESWHSSSTGIIEAELNSIAANASGTIVVTTSGRSVNLWRYAETDETWIHVLDGIPDNALVQQSGGYFWLLENGRVHRSLDGEEWTLLEFPNSTVLNNVSCTINGNCIFPTIQGRIYWSDNFGDSLILTPDNLPSDVSLGEAMHLSEDSVIVVTGRHAYKNTNIRSVDIYLSVDEGFTWSKISELDLDEQIAWDAVIIRDGKYNLYLGNAYYNELLVSSDNGFTWDNISHQGEVRGIFTANDDYLYANLDFFRIERTKDFGNTWELYMEGLPAGPSLPFNAATGSDSKFVYLHLRDVYYKGIQAEYIQKGVYKRNTLTGIAKVNSDKISNLKIYPNPAAGFITIEYPDFKPHASNTVKMFDISGRMVKEIVLNRVKTVVDITNFTPGTYFLNGTSLIIE